MNEPQSLKARGRGTESFEGRDENAFMVADDDSMNFPPPADQ